MQKLENDISVKQCKSFFNYCVKFKASKRAYFSILFQICIKFDIQKSIS